MALVRPFISTLVILATLFPAAFSRAEDPPPTLPSGPIPAQGVSEERARLDDSRRACSPDAAREPCAPCMHGVDCVSGVDGEPRWRDARPMDFGPQGPGEFVGPPRWAAAQEQRIRFRDELRLTYVLTRSQPSGPYRLMAGDTLVIDSSSDEDLKANPAIGPITVQPDGTISVPMLPPIQASGLTIEQLRGVLEKRYEKFLKDPKININPTKTNSILIDLQQAIGGQSGLNPATVTQTVALDGKIRLPLIGAVCVQGLTLEEIKTEINLRYRQVVAGVEIEPSISAFAPHFVYVLGEVTTSGRFELQTPTTVLGAIALAGGDRLGGNLRQVVVIRRADDWRMIATMLDLRGAILGKTPTPADNIWLRDGDVVIVPRTPVQIANNFIRQVFTQGIYGVVPFTGISINLGNQR